MFLNRLTLEEKENFVSLAVRGAEANDIVTNEEYAMIEEYCKEMSISFFDAKNIKSMDEIIELYLKSSEENKRIVVMELIGLMNADGDFDNKEREFVYKFAEKIGVAKDMVERLIDMISRYLALTKEIINVIGL